MASGSRPRQFGKRGLFVNGIWHCDCQPTRLPAEKFEVKNGSKNHGRLFYTCQSPQPKKCNFFLWADDAKVREEAVVLNNSRSEPGVGPDHNVGSGRRLRTDQDSPKAPPRQTKLTESLPAHKPTIVEKPRFTAVDKESAATDDAVDHIDWSSSDYEDFPQNVSSHKVLELETRRREPAHKAIKTSLTDSPGRRWNNSLETEPASVGRTHADGHREVPRTPTRAASRPQAGLLSPNETPFKTQRLLFPTLTTSAQPAIPATANDNDTRIPLEPQSEARPKYEYLTLMGEAMSILEPVRSRLPRETMNELVALIHRHTEKSRGIEKGRNLVRASLAEKDKRIAELEVHVSQLLLQHETHKNIIKHLKEDITNQLMTSPKRSRRDSKYSSNR